MEAAKADEKEKLVKNLVKLAKKIGYKVEFEVDLSEQDDEGEWNKGPAGVCRYNERLIQVRKDKGINGKISTLIHEVSHALGLSGYFFPGMLGGAYLEWAAESITQHVTQLVGIERSDKTQNRVMGYGFYRYLSDNYVKRLSDIIYNNIRLESG